MNRVRRFTRNRSRLIVIFALGIAVAFSLPSDWYVVTRALTGWNVAVWLYLCLMAWLMTHANHARIRKIADQEDEGAVAVLIILSTAAALSLVAIVFELATAKALPFGSKMGHYAFTGLTILGSWLLVGVIFTVHYAHAYYRSAPNVRGLRFPGNEINPDYWDFLYFSFTIVAAAQTSDVIVTTRSMRKAVLAQTILSFLFNAAIIGMSINIAAGVIGG